MANKKRKKTPKYMVEILSGTFVLGKYHAKGTKLKVSKEFHDRVILEKDGQLKAFNK
jgi:hypothetical protein